MTMKRTVKSTLSLLLVLVMLVSLLPAMTIPVKAAAGDPFYPFGTSTGGSALSDAKPDAAAIKFTDYLEINAQSNKTANYGSWSVADDGDAQIHTLVSSTYPVVFYARAKTAVTVNYEAVFPAGSDTQLAAAGVYDYSTGEWSNQIGTCTTKNWYSKSYYTQLSSDTTWSGMVSLEVGDVIAVGVYYNSGWGDYSATVKLSLDQSSLVPQKQYTISPKNPADTAKIWQSDSVYRHPMSVCVTDPSGVSTWVHGGDNNSHYDLEADLYNATFDALLGSTVKIVLYFFTDDPLNNDDTVDVIYVPGNITDGAGVVLCESPYTGNTTLDQGTKLTYTFTVPEDTSDATLYYDIVPVHYPIKVEKDLDSATVTIAQSGNLKHVGAVTLSGSSMTFAVDKHNAGRDVTFTASGYAPLAYDVEWYLGNTKVAGGASYTAAPDILITGGTVKAKFIEKMFSVSAAVDSACTDMGTVSVSSGSVGYNKTVTFTASPSYGYEFVGWFNGNTRVSENAAYTTNITANTALTAKFKVSTRTVAAYVQAGSQGLGTATVTPGTVNYGSTATFTATANDGYEFVAWYDANGTNPVFENPYVVSITADTTLYAKFDKRWIESEFGYNDKGTYTITGEDISYTVTNADVSFYAWVNDEVTLTVTSSAENYEFAGWYVNGKQISAQQTFTFKLGDYENQMIYPQWKEKANVIVTFKPGEGGSYTVNGAAPTGGAVAYYADIVVKATANTNYRFVAWVDGNGNVLSGNAEETFLMAAVKDKTITPVFEYIYATITLPGVSGGSYTIEPKTDGDTTAAVTVNGSNKEFTGIKGNSYTVTATPDSEHVFVRWENADGTQVGIANTYTIANFSSNSYVKPVFAEKYVTITLPAIAEGSYTLTSKDGTDTVTVSQEAKTHKALKDTAYTLTINIPHSYAFLGWANKDGNTLGYSETYEAANVNNGVQPMIEDRSILQKLPAPTNGSYTIQADGSDVVLETVRSEAVTLKGRHDLTYTLTAIPADGYHFVMWIDQNGALVSYNAVMNGYRLSESTSVTPVFASNRVTVRFPAVIGATYYVYCGDTLEATVTDDDVFFTGDYNADYRIVVGSLSANYRNIGYLIDENGTKIEGSDAAGFTFKLDANKVIKPFIGYYGTDIALGAVIGSGSYTFGEKDSAPAYTIRDTAATASNIDRTKTYVLTATADAGYKFAQWQTKDGKFLSDEATLEGNMPASVVAMFVKEDSAAYTVDSIPYYHLDLAAAAAQKANVKTVLVTNGGNIYHSQGETSFEIPNGVTFIVPHRADVDSIKSRTDSAAYACASYISDYPDSYATPNDGHTYIELKLPANNTLTVEGIMAVGGTLNGAGAIAGGYPHANVHLGSGASLVVGGGSSYGYLSTCGFIYGPGNVEVKAKGQLLQPFAFNDFRGGGYTVGAAAKMTEEANNFQAILNNAGDPTGILPFNRYTLMGVYSTITARYGGYVTGYVDMFAGGEHNRCTVNVVANDETQSMFALKDAYATATITYNPGKIVSSVNNIGRTKITLNGNTVLGGLTFNINVGVRASINSRQTILPLPYNWEIEVAGGTFTVGNKLQLMPGATIRVREGAAMNVNSQLTVYKGLIDHTSAGVSVKGSSNFTAVLSGYESNYSGYNVVYPTKPYPSTEQLAAADFSGAGELIVNGTLNLNSGSFGGVVQTESNNAVITVAGGMGMSTYSRIGCAGYWQYTVGQAGFMYELAGATKHYLNAQLVNAATGELTDMVAGKTYYGTTAKDGTIDSYAYTLCHAANGNTVYTTDITVGSEEAPLGIATKGAWGEYTVEIIDTTKNETVREVFMANADVSDRDFYSDANGETKVETITASGTVYYIPSYTVIWMDGETNLGESKVLHGKAPAYPSEFTEPTKEGYAFIGWAADAAATTGTKLEDLAAVTEDIAYYAVFAKEYTITYNMNEGAWAADAVVPETYVVGSELTLPTAESLTREGWTFVGWYGNAAYTGDKLTEITADPAANVDLYARWKQKVEAVEATCIADGNLEYWTDGINNYKDEALTEQYEENGWIVKSKGHTYGEPDFTWNATAESATCTATFVCTVCNEDTENHELPVDCKVTEKTRTPATCSADGSVVYTATVEFGDKSYTADSDAVVIPATGVHSLTETEANAATCTAPGNSAYWTCGTCGKYFSDAEGKEEIEKDSWILDQLDHSYTGEWVITADGHARKCVNGCNGTDTVAEHIDNNTDNVCDDCGYAIPGAGGGEEEAYVPTIGNGTTSVKPDENGNVTFKAGTSGPDITVTAPTDDWKIGENTFTVASTNDIACVVIVKDAKGNYTRIPATTNTETGIHSFVAKLDKDCEIIVAVKGDGTGDGKFTAADYNMVKAAFFGTQLTDLQSLKADVNGDGKFSAADYNMVKAAFFGTYLPW